jgi:FKBP-type peptidyl-prolyl cis-trans isomerase
VGDNPEGRLAILKGRGKINKRLFLLLLSLFLGSTVFGVITATYSAAPYITLKKGNEVSTPTGLQYEIVKDSEGEKPLENDTVRVNYRLTYLDGREGDSSIRGIPSTFDLSAMIPGFREGLMLMGVGSEFRFFVHPNLGYGASGSTKIEPNTLLIFDVALVEILN